MRSSLLREVVMSTFYNFNRHKQSINADNNGLLQPCSVTVCCRAGCTSMWWWVCSLSQQFFSYLSGVASGIRLPEEGVGQLPHPHGQGGRLPGRLAGVHHGAEEGLQLRLRVPADVHDLLPGRRRAAVRVHVAKVFGVATKSVEKKKSSITDKREKQENHRQGPVKADASGVMIGFVYTFRPPPSPLPTPRLNFLCPCASVRSCNISEVNRLGKQKAIPGRRRRRSAINEKKSEDRRAERRTTRYMPPTYLQAARPFPLSLSPSPSLSLSLSLSLCIPAGRRKKRKKKKKKETGEITAGETLTPTPLSDPDSRLKIPPQVGWRGGTKTSTCESGSGKVTSARPPNFFFFFFHIHSAQSRFMWYCWGAGRQALKLPQLQGHIFQCARARTHALTHHQHETERTAYSLMINFCTHQTSHAQP